MYTKLCKACGADEAGYGVFTRARPGARHVAAASAGVVHPLHAALLYAATAVHAAAAEHVPLVHLPGNGQLTPSPPLSAARAGACSTRSVHPWKLHHLNRVISEVADPVAEIRVENPFATLSKGEVCEVAHNAGLPQQVLEATLSCGASPTADLLGPPSLTAASTP